MTVRRTTMASRTPISVVLPVYNGAKYIESAIRSLLDQSEDCEIVVSDDCSIDNTREIVRSIKAPRLILLENEVRGGQFVNFNRALRAANGQYIQLFSHDDVARPGFLGSQIRHFHQDPTIGLTYASCNIIDAQGLWLAKCDDHGTPYLVDFKTYLAISSLHGSLPLSVSCVMIARQVLEIVGLFDERFAIAGDLEFYNRVAERFTIARNRAMLLDVRVHGGSVTLSNSAPLKYMREEIDILPFYRRHLGEADYKTMIRRRMRGRGAAHAKYIIRSFLAGHLGESRAAYRALSRVHNVPICILYALLQATGTRLFR
jgi:glycosyltransferase involved in cell wall biosynthesis